MWFLVFLLVLLYFALRKETFVVDDKLYHSSYRSFVKLLPFRHEYRKLRRFLK